jgi:hypothetical protein
MEPITRKELQDAKEAAEVAAREFAVRQEELKGLVWAESMYKAVCQAATDGKKEIEADPAKLSDLAYSYAFHKVKALFPDSDVDTMIYGSLSNQPIRKTLRVSWA